MGGKEAATLHGSAELVLMSLNWSEIFARRPDLEPPGYKEAAEKVAKEWATKERKRKKSSNSKRKVRFPSAKHGAD